MKTLAPNPLIEFVWGRVPASRARRRQALLNLWFPLACYLVVLACLLAVDAANRAGIDPLRAPSRRSQTLALFAFTTSVIVFPTLLFIGAMRLHPPRVLRRNWIDYRIVGLGGREMLWGLAGPSLAGAFILAASHFVLLSLSHLLLMVQYKIDWLDDKTWGMPLLAFSLSSSLVVGSVIDVSLWALTGRWYPRMIAVVLVLVLSPLLVLLFMVLSLVWPWTFSGFSPYLIVTALAELLLAPAKLLFAGWLWRRACASLEGDSLES